MKANRYKAPRIRGGRIIKQTAIPLDLIKILKVQVKGIRFAFASEMAYRADFFISSLIRLAGNLVVPLVTYLIYSTGASFPGWNIYEVLLIQGIFMISQGIASSLFFGMIGTTLYTIREGTFDLLLLKPHPVLHVAMATSFSCDGLGILLGGTTLSVIALTHLPPIPVIRYGVFLLLMCLSVIVLLSFSLIMSATAFKWVGNSRIFEIFDSITFFGQYPMSIFSKAFAGLLTWVLPVSMIAFMPASALLGKEMPGIIPAIAVTFVLLAFGIIIWNTMKRLYTSAGG